MGESVKNMVRFRYGKPRLFIGVVILCAVLGLFVWMGDEDSPQVIHEGKIRTDRGPVEKRFPGLGHFRACYWTGGLVGKRGFLSVGPSSYWMKRIVVLDPIDFKELKKRYAWKAAPPGWRPSWVWKGLQDSSNRWATSEEFNSRVKPENLFGNLYLDLENGVVYLDVQS